MLNKSQENLSETVKKVAKNTLKHLKNNHPTLTLSELTEALSKGLGFNNYHAVTQQNNSKSMSAKSLNNWNDLNVVDELTLYYPNRLINVMLEDKIKLKKYPFNTIELSKKITNYSNLNDSAENILQKGLIEDSAERWVFEENEKNTTYVISDIVNKMTEKEKKRISKLCGINIAEFLVLTLSDYCIDTFYKMINILIKSNFPQEYMDYIKSAEKNSYVSFNYDEKEISLFLENIKESIESLKSGDKNEIEKDIFYMILLFFRLLLNNNMFYASLNEKIIYFILSRHRFIEENECCFFYVEYIVEHERTPLVMDKVRLVERALNSLYPKIKVLTYSKSHYEKEKGMMYYNEDKKVISIQLNFKR